MGARSVGVDGKENQGGCAGWAGRVLGKLGRGNVLHRVFVTKWDDSQWWWCSVIRWRQRGGGWGSAANLRR